MKNQAQKKQQSSLEKQVNKRQPRHTLNEEENYQRSESSEEIPKSDNQSSTEQSSTEKNQSRTEIQIKKQVKLQKNKKNPQLRKSQPSQFRRRKFYQYPYYYDSSGCFYCFLCNGHCIPCRICHQTPFACICDAFPCCNGCFGFHCGCLKYVPCCGLFTCVQNDKCQCCEIYPCCQGCKHCAQSCDGSCLNTLPCFNRREFSDIKQFVPCCNGWDFEKACGCIICCNDNFNRQQIKEYLNQCQCFTCCQCMADWDCRAFCDMIGVICQFMGILGDS